MKIADAVTGEHDIGVYACEPAQALRRDLVENPWTVFTEVAADAERADDVTAGHNPLAFAA